MKPLTHLEDATLRLVLAHAPEMDGWLDLTRIASSTGRMLPDIRQAVARLERRDLLEIDGEAANTERWIRFLVPGVAKDAEGVRARPPAP